MSVPALLHELILREIDVTLIKRYFEQLYIPLRKTAHFKRDSPISRVEQGRYTSVPALLHALILREIDVTLITRHIQSHFETI